MALDLEDPSVPPSVARRVRPGHLMEKRVLVAALVSAVFLAWYSKLLTTWYPTRSSPQPAGDQQPVQEKPEPVPKTANPSLYPLAEEDIIVIQSQDLEAEIGASSGAIRQVTLRQFMDGSGKHPLQIVSGLHLFHLQIGELPISWHPIATSSSSVTLDGVGSNGDSYHISYALDSLNPIIEIILHEPTNFLKDIVITSSWTQGDKLADRYNPLEIMLLVEDGAGNQKHKRYIGTTRQEKIVPRGTFLVSLAERYFCQSMKPHNGTVEVRLLPSPEGAVVAESRIHLSEAAQMSEYTLSLYVGPRDYFRLKRAGFGQAFPIGMLGQIGLILLSVLSFIAGITKNYGVAIILFSGLITCALAPFTLLSFKSMKKMQELKPQIDKLTAQHKNDPARANKEVFALYKQHRISPLSGCLPMLLQMPILIALFQSISHFVELRGKSFLWIRDLSLPDRMAQLPLSIPFIGNELNALPIIMAAVMYVQTRMSQGKMSSDQSNPAAKLMSGPTMSIVFGLMFYQFPSGLVLYWLMNSLTSLVWYKIAK